MLPTAWPCDAQRRAPSPTLCISAGESTRPKNATPEEGEDGAPGTSPAVPPPMSDALMLEVPGHITAMTAMRATRDEALRAVTDLGKTTLEALRAEIERKHTAALEATKHHEQLMISLRLLSGRIGGGCAPLPTGRMEVAMRAGVRAVVDTMAFEVVTTPPDVPTPQRVVMLPRSAGSFVPPLSRGRLYAPRVDLLVPAAFDGNWSDQVLHMIESTRRAGGAGAMSKHWRPAFNAAAAAQMAVKVQLDVDFLLEMVAADLDDAVAKAATSKARAAAPAAARRLVAEFRADAAAYAACVAEAQTALAQLQMAIRGPYKTARLTTSLDETDGAKYVGFLRMKTPLPEPSSIRFAGLRAGCAEAVGAVAVVPSAAAVAHVAAAGPDGAAADVSAALTRLIPPREEDGNDATKHTLPVSDQHAEDEADDKVAHHGGIVPDHSDGVPSAAACSDSAATDVAKAAAARIIGSLADGDRAFYGVPMVVVVIDEMAAPAAFRTDDEQSVCNDDGVRIGLVPAAAKPTDETIEAGGGFAITIFRDRPGILGKGLTALKPQDAVGLSASDVTAIAAAGPASSGRSVDATHSVPPAMGPGWAIAIGLDLEAGTCRLIVYDPAAVQAGFDVDARTGEGLGKATARMELRLSPELIQALADSQVFVAIEASRWTGIHVL